MKVSVRSTDGSVVTVHDLDDETVMPLIEALGNDTDRVIALALDDGMVYLLKRNIVRIDVG